MLLFASDGVKHTDELPYRLLTPTGFSVIGMLLGCNLKSIAQSGKHSIRLDPPEVCSQQAVWKGKQHNLGSAILWMALRRKGKEQWV